MSTPHWGHLFQCLLLDIYCSQKQLPIPDFVSSASLNMPFSSHHPLCQVIDLVNHSIYRQSRGRTANKISYLYFPDSRSCLYLFSKPNLSTHRQREGQPYWISISNQVKIINFSLFIPLTNLPFSLNTNYCKIHIFLNVKKL